MIDRKLISFELVDALIPRYGESLITDQTTVIDLRLAGLPIAKSLIRRGLESGAIAQLINPKPLTNGRPFHIKGEGWFVSGPAVAGTVVFAANTLNTYFAIDTATGQSIWGQPYFVPETITGDLAVNEDTLFLGSDEDLYAIDIKTGLASWSVSLGWPLSGRPVIKNGIVYVATQPKGNGANFYALMTDPRIPADAPIGDRLLWGLMSVRSFHTPELVGENVIVANHAGQIELRNAQTKDLLASKTLEKEEFTSPPTHADGLIFICAKLKTGRDARLCIFNAKTLELVNSRSLLAAFEKKPIVEDGFLYFGCNDKSLYAYDIAKGRFAWQFPTGGPVQSSPVINDGKVYFGSADGNFYAVDVKTGNLAWRYKAADMIICDPVIVNGLVCFGSHDKHFYALDAQTGEDQYGRIISKDFIEKALLYRAVTTDPNLRISSQDLFDMACQRITESDPIERRFGAEILAYIFPQAKGVRATLEKFRETDPDETVRRAAEKGLNDAYQD